MSQRSLKQGERSSKEKKICDREKIRVSFTKFRVPDDQEPNTTTGSGIDRKKRGGRTRNVREKGFRSSRPQLFPGAAFKEKGFRKKEKKLGWTKRATVPTGGGRAEKVPLPGGTMTKREKKYDREPG